MPIPVFLSRPTSLPPAVEAEAIRFERFLNGHGYVPQRLGGANFTTKAPLTAVMDLMKTCSGAIILGYPQASIVTRGLRSDFSYDLPTPWNQIEGALAYAFSKPTLVVAHSTITGGVFDYGITGEYVLKTDLLADKWFQAADFDGVFNEWKKYV